MLKGRSRSVGHNVLGLFLCAGVICFIQPSNAQTTVTTTVTTTTKSTESAPTKTAVKKRPTKLTKAAKPATTLPQKVAPTQKGDTITPPGVEIVEEGGASKPAVNASESTSPGMLKFNTESDSTLTEQRAPYQFKVPSGAGTDSLDTKLHDEPLIKSGISDDEPFRAYVGYPKHTVGGGLSAESISSKWSGDGQGYNFTSSTMAYVLDYTFQVSPVFALNLDWTRRNVGVAAASLNAGNLLVRESEETYDTFLASGRHCFVNSVTFYQQFCPGVVVGKDSYPIVQYEGDTAHLKMGKVDDIVVGVKMDYQVPITDSTLFKTALGYNVGTGIGNSGQLTSKNNSSLNFNAFVWWQTTEKHNLGFGLDYLLRDAKLEGTIGSNTYSWETKSSVLGAKVVYGYTF